MKTKRLSTTICLLLISIAVLELGTYPISHQAQNRFQMESKALKLKHQPEIWYHLLFWLNTYNIQGRIWEKDHPEMNTSFTLLLPNEGLPIRQIEYRVMVPESTIEIDEFQELEFSE